MKNTSSKPPRSNCPITFSVDIIGDKWSLLVIRDIALRGKKTFSEFTRSDEKIATNILADRLKRLEYQDVIKKSPFEDARHKFVYSLTEKGIAMIPMLVEMILFSHQFDKQSPVSDEFITPILRDKSAFIAQLQQKYRDMSTT